MKASKRRLLPSKEVWHIWKTCRHVEKSQMTVGISGNFHFYGSTTTLGYREKTLILPVSIGRFAEWGYLKTVPTVLDITGKVRFPRNDRHVVGFETRNTSRLQGSVLQVPCGLSKECWCRSSPLLKEEWERVGKVVRTLHHPVQRAVCTHVGVYGVH